MNTRAAVEALVDFFEHLRPESLGAFADYYAADACFKDPFNEVRGLPAIERIFAHLFRQVDEPRFIVGERLVDGQAALLVWELRFRAKGSRGPGAPQCIRGASHLRFADDGKVLWHRDYWDAAEELYARLPLLGWLMRLLQRKLSASGTAAE
ncbi:MAG TPA: nuclear transport factor 2 family protein [Candidatus Accumulibacter phosphatis]|nr:MAG: SnoaL-like domain protein [Candidatus Accumulibacter sp. SK-11]HAY29771.1 nuclear transport factor 2 family protein [Accumulibacter sp.]HRL75099.1 nuclear transport factor 2 family protein [Candidatus Accumulibacter phosphatis]HCN69328.1 nuclear transport factor 2 family protein [Accumulibacter sp.]HCV13847.1 nuclear transport factor 2 family protein [Accumulibacter sp.]